MDNFSEKKIELNLIKTDYRVFLVSCPTDSTVLIALHLKIDDNDVSWFDTVKQRIMQVGEVLENSDSKFSFKRADEGHDEIYEFQPLTLDIYREIVRPQLRQAGDFNSEAEMVKAFELTLENAW